jgi:hypothetical protein
MILMGEMQLSVVSNAPATTLNIVLTSFVTCAAILGKYFVLRLRGQCFRMARRRRSFSRVLASWFLDPTCGLP